MPLLLDRLTVYGEMLDVVAAVLRDSGPTEIGSLWPRLFPLGSSEEPRRELLAYLHDLAIISPVPASPGHLQLDRGLADGRDLRLHILANLRQSADENSVITDLYRFLITDESYAGRLLDRDQIWPLYNRYQQASGSTTAMLNSPKMASWLRLTSFLGLVRPERSNTFVISPSFALLRAILRDILDTDHASLPAAVNQIEATYCSVLLRPGRLHPGWSDALQILETQGEISLATLGDAGSLAVGQRQLSHIRFLPTPFNPEVR